MPSGTNSLFEDLQRRTRQLEALYETAGDLTALRDVDKVLEAIVRRSRQLLGSDVAYLMLLDEDRQQIYMRVGEGIQTQEFLDIELGFGEGIAGLVASSGMPLWTSDYARDAHLAARIDSTVKRESLVAIVGVPLSAGGRALGVLLASDRRARNFTHDEVALLGSLAHHAAIALENASLFQEAQRAVARWQEANARVEQQNTVLERAAALHEQLMGLVLEGAPVSALAEAVAATVGGEVILLDANGVALTHTPDLQPLAALDLEGASAAAGRVYEIPRSKPATQVVAVQAGSRRLGLLLHRGETLTASDVRALERASMVTALLLLDRSAHDEARVRAMSGVFGEFTSGEQRNPSQVRRRAQAAGVTVPTGPYVAAVALASADGDRAINLDKVALLAVEVGWLVRVEGRQVSVLMQGRNATATAKTLAAQLTELVGEPMTVGAAGPTDHLAGLPGLLTRAQTCAKVLETTGRRGSGATAEDLGVYALLFSDVGRERIEAFVSETIGPLQEWDDSRAGHLLLTLEAYFEQGGQTGRLAEALYVHVNTLYQRLDRIDRLLGPGWRRGEQALQVHLAVRLVRLLSHPM